MNSDPSTVPGNTAAPGAAALQELRRRTAVDAAYRAEVLADPRAALLAAGVPVADGVRVRVVEVAPHQVVLPLPPVVSDDVELSEDLLAGASGGATPFFALGVAYVGLFGTWGYMTVTGQAAPLEGD
ncbi:hypothetical protein [Nakamurella leprariae]|uniref:NHLP leader peptide family natural product n=1 Tax=Nakamurella leprariae TaxID=2803911 RepID=A0A938Y530_9ACTN|nr:hypothetical protein [Nakamurella leprariae]MBM9465915.1 hypothetical protein [Nakamurella leprariae]